MSPFVKLYGSILDSSVWAESVETRLLWITLLAMADGNGFVRTSIPGLAHRARISREGCEAALATLEAPDPDSGSPEHEGRRIEPREGGFLILNHRKYRDLRTEAQGKAAARARRFRERHSASEGVTRNARNAPQRTEAEAEAYAEQEEKKPVAPLPPALNAPEFVAAWEDWLAYRRESKLPAWQRRTVEAQFAKLAEVGPARAVEAIRQSIANGWRGLFPEKATQRKGSAIPVGDWSKENGAAWDKKVRRVEA